MKIKVFEHSDKKFGYIHGETLEHTEIIAELEVSEKDFAKLEDMKNTTRDEVDKILMEKLLDSIEMTPYKKSNGRVSY